MSCRSALYTVNQTNQTLTPAADAFTTIPFGNIIRRFGRHINTDGTGIYINDPGYYDVGTVANVTPAAAGPITLKMTNNGVDIPGMSVTVTGTADEPLTIPLRGLIRLYGCNSGGLLTLSIDSEVTILNVSTVVERI